MVSQTSCPIPPQFRRPAPADAILPLLAAARFRKSHLENG
jgi:hypothetical protein